MAVGTAGVVDYSNTTSGTASGVVATGGIGGAGIFVQGSVIPPHIPNYIVAEDGSRLDAENADNLITQT